MLENDEHKLKPVVFKVLLDRHYPAVCRRLTGLLDVIAVDFHFLRRHLPGALSGKNIITSSKHTHLKGGIKKSLA